MMIDFDEFAELIGGFIKENITGNNLDVCDGYLDNLEEFKAKLEECIGVI